jgi:hypothetical protein
VDGVLISAFGVLEAGFVVQLYHTPILLLAILWTMFKIGQMEEWFNDNPDILHIDALYKVNLENFVLCNFVVQLIVQKLTTCCVRIHAP